MKKMCQGMVDCVNCRFGHKGDASCGEGRSVIEEGLQGCARGLAIRVKKTPLQEYKEQMMMPGMQPGRRAGA